MPKQVDHESRRRMLADAVCALAHERGLEGVTLRDVAERAGVSMGAVQRCFPTRDEMLVFALQYVGERVTARAKERLASSRARTPRARLIQLVTEVALLDAKHRAEAGVWLVFVSQAAVTPRLAEVIRESYADLHGLLERLLGELGIEGMNPRIEARALLALADGLTTHVLIGHLSTRAAMDVLDKHLSRFRPTAAGEC
ncbi:TetR/AcrR family transcriptional regulator [Polyangium sp. 15x6]|uniref:TetR/AcrR family transcriptional regulator n=1 Tax=Polyangium sp. 15x6 TaxID=3042687 RepID=UPI00249AB659|nr:TetR/AcrR family transcriptional regulator [Polyangium sp. 15x6]MDI3281819.1 TetR/AcrR family transcriptional regulator [Polyangium sp. 15x6]